MGPGICFTCSQRIVLIKTSRHIALILHIFLSIPVKLKFLDFFIYKCVCYSFYSVETKLKAMRLLFQQYLSLAIYERVLHDENLIISLANAKFFAAKSNACVGSTFCTLKGTKCRICLQGNINFEKDMT